MNGMTHPTLQLLVKELVPGSFVWTLMETDAHGKALKTARRSDDTFESYEAALAVGTRALHAQLHAQEQPAR